MRSFSYLSTPLVPLVLAALASGCGVPKAKYAELENQYTTAVKERDQAKAEADSAKSDLQEFKEKNRKRLETFAEVYAELLKIQGDKLAKVKIEDGRAVLQLDSDVLFASGSAQLTPDGVKTIDALATALTAAKDARFQVEGHTDSDAIKNTKEFPTNWHLGADRAINVTLEMVKQGLPADRISAATYGQNQPVADNSTVEGKKENRRIEVVWMPDLSETLPYKRMEKELKDKLQAEKPAEPEAAPAPAQ